MNKELKDRVFNIPQNILNQINHTVGGLMGKHADGLMRAKKLLSDKTVTYGQLKRIIHDLQTIDKVKDRTKYNLAGGDLMNTWSKQYLQGERNSVSNAKDSRKRADDIGSITGERRNSHLASHKKRDNFRIPTNPLKSNSDKTSVSSIITKGLFEEIEKIKKLIIY
jgi:hypothetical protein